MDNHTQQTKPESYFSVVSVFSLERFTPCFFFYLMAVLPCIWLLELTKTDLYIQGKLPALEYASNSSTEKLFAWLKLSPMTWIMVVEEMLPYVLFVSRWILPRGRVEREQLAELLFAFIEIAADIMEFFALFDENVIRSDKNVAYAILGIWSLSVLQFTMTVKVIHLPKKVKKVKANVMNNTQVKEWEKVRKECWAIFITIMMQDLPYASMRLYTIINFKYLTYSLIFFTTKNLIIILLLLYKVAALCKRRYYTNYEDFLGTEETVEADPEKGIAQNGLCPKGSKPYSLYQPSLQPDKSEMCSNDSHARNNDFDNVDHSNRKKGANKTQGSSKKYSTQRTTISESSTPGQQSEICAEEKEKGEENNSTVL